MGLGQSRRTTIFDSTCWRKHCHVIRPAFRGRPTESGPPKGVSDLSKVEPNRKQNLMFHCDSWGPKRLRESPPRKPIRLAGPQWATPGPTRFSPKDRLSSPGRGHG